MRKKLADFLGNNQFIKNFGVTDEEYSDFIRSIEQEFLVEFLSSVIRESEEILAIDPHLERKKILELAAANIVRDLNAEAATIRLFDPKSLKMLNFGSYGLEGHERASTVPAMGSIAGKVARENNSIQVPSILKDPLYQNKEIVKQKGYHSLLAVPLRMPSFVGPSDDILGSLQIYYKEDNRLFDPLEVIHAEMLARRVSFVLAKKKILDLKALNDRKEKIVDKIFIKLSNREGIKLKDFFVLLIPELSEFLQVQSCSLFSLSEDRKHIRLEAAYPLDSTYHDPGHTFTVSHHPYFNIVISGLKEHADNPFERIDENYLLIKDPMKSKLTSPGIREFVEQHKIHSILLVPLRIDSSVRHILAYYATEQKQYFTEEEIELLTFFGKEIMKASKLEILGDILHDFKNPAVAVAGFAARARKLLENEDLNTIKEKLITYLDVVAKETTRLEDLALTMTGEGREEIVDLVTVAKERYLLNKEAVRESKRFEIQIHPIEAEENLFVFCPIYALERVIDNLLNNAAKAVPKIGGGLGMRCYREEGMASVEVSNSGEISASAIDDVRKGAVKGRGLNIISRFAQTNHGKIDIRAEKGRTYFTLKLPLHADKV